MNKLVDDFNEMAEKLQTLDAQRNLWNAAIAHELRTPVTILRGGFRGWLTEYSNQNCRSSETSLNKLKV
jgi:signal transduction histidine kinase